MTSFRLLLLLALAASSLPMQAQSINGRKASPRATIAGSRDLYDGNFVATGVASACGVIPREASMTGTATFVIEYPSDVVATDQIQSVSFGSNELVDTVKTSSSFRFRIGVRLPNGSQPYAYVLNTDPPGTPNTGTATLETKKDGSLTLTVTGKNDRGETVQFTMTCM